LAGLALLVAALIRPETLLVCGLAAIVLASKAIAAQAGRGSAPPRAAWLVLLGLLAIPLGMAHDLLLTGNALYSLQVPGVGTEIRDPQSSGTALRIVTRHLMDFLPMLLLAALGLVVLVQRRAWPVLVGSRRSSCSSDRGTSSSSTVTPCRSISRSSVRPASASARSPPRSCRPSWRTGRGSGQPGTWSSRRRSPSR
jgi:hypothetical protein